jgi:hypothetical protein
MLQPSFVCVLLLSLHPEHSALILQSMLLSIHPCRLTIPAAELDTMKNALYPIQVTVTNWLGATHTAAAAFEKVASGQAPVVSVAGGTQQTFKLAEGVQLTAQLLAPSVCPGKKVRLTAQATAVRHRGCA